MQRSTDLDDIKYFAEIFRYAKRSGGDVIGIIKQTSHIIHEKAEVQQRDRYNNYRKEA